MKFLKKNKKTIISVGIFLLIGISLFLLRSRNSTEEVKSVFAVIYTVEADVVSSGIETTGTIVAAQKLNLDVYKQTQRIESVNVVNGGAVTAGTKILSFDKSRANVNVQSSRVKISKANLDLNQIKENLNDPNTSIRNLDQQVKNLNISLSQFRDNKIDTYRDFLNKDLKLEPESSSEIGSNTPLVTGYYNNSKEGEYKIEVYPSAADSGYSFRYSGLSSGTETIYLNAPIAIGDFGIELVFSGVIKGKSQWVLALPNTYSSSYLKNKEDYKKLIIDLDKKIQSLKIELDNAQQSLGDESFSDDQDFRSLTLKRAQSELAQARVELSENIDVVQDQNIIAPFSGTIEGLENVVVGATPTRDTNDPISFGTLISNDFMVKFSLSAVDVAKTILGQKVIVDITSFKDIQSLEAVITEISSLPKSDNIAQYEVQALIKLPKGLDISLREGLLADVQIVQEEVFGAIRVPKSSIRYEKGKAFVDVIDALDEKQQQEVSDLGIIRSEAGIFPSYPVEIIVGINGVFYVEIISGISEGMQIIATQNDQEKEVVQQANFRGRPRE
jgi:multidrug efflux pump subunit AcrA (membrane-fusion protein)